MPQCSSKLSRSCLKPFPVGNWLKIIRYHKSNVHQALTDPSNLAALCKATQAFSFVIFTKDFISVVQPEIRQISPSHGNQSRSPGNYQPVMHVQKLLRNPCDRDENRNSLPSPVALNNEGRCNSYSAIEYFMTTLTIDLNVNSHYVLSSVLWVFVL